jgi:hypothetical protein
VLVDVFLDNKLKDTPESARFSFKAEPSAIDQFVLDLRDVENDRTWVATLNSDSLP